MQLPFVPPDHRQIGAYEKFRLVQGLGILFCSGQCREFSNRICSMIIFEQSQPKSVARRQSSESVPGPRWLRLFLNYPVAESLCQFALQFDNPALLGL